MQTKGNRRGRKLVACLYGENRVVIHDIPNNTQEEVTVKRPWRCATSTSNIAVTSSVVGIHVLAHNGSLVRIDPTSKHVSCVTFHPSLGRVFLGFKNGSVQTCSALDKTLSSFKVHSDFVTNIRCAANDRVLLSSWDKTASIVTFEGKLPSSSTVKLIGHTAGVSDIILLS
jgi:hypothetical protein